MPFEPLGPLALMTNPLLISISNYVSKPHLNTTTTPFFKYEGYKRDLNLGAVLHCITKVEIALIFYCSIQIKAT